MNRASSIAALALLVSSGAFAAEAPVPGGDRWWKHVEVLSSDVQPLKSMNGVGVMLLTGMALEVADAPGRPRWNDDSFFRRFAKPAPVPAAKP